MSAWLAGFATGIVFTLLALRAIAVYLEARLARRIAAPRAAAAPASRPAAAEPASPPSIGAGLAETAGRTSRTAGGSASRRDRAR